MADSDQQQHQHQRQGFAHDFALFDLIVSASRAAYATRALVICEWLVLKIAPADDTKAAIQNKRRVRRVSVSWAASGKQRA
jgi:hypothetical protein